MSKHHTPLKSLIKDSHPRLSLHRRISKPKNLSSCVKRTGRIYRQEVARVNPPMRTHKLNMSLENSHIRSVKPLSFAKSYSEILVPILSETSYLHSFRSPNRRQDSHKLSRLGSVTEHTDVHIARNSRIHRTKQPIDFELKVRRIMTRFDSVKERLETFHRANLVTKQALLQLPSSRNSVDQSF